jgi:TBC1 domain family protein 5
MHELLAVCLVTVDRDSLVAEPGRTRISPLLTTPAAVRDEAMIATLDRAYAEHDAFSLFMQLMKPAKAFYEWRSEEGRVRHRCDGADDSHSGQRRPDPSRPSSRAVSTSTRSYDGSTPSCGRGSRARASSHKYGPCELHVLQEADSSRWIRLILTRELPFGAALRLWDGMFAEDPSLGILDYVCLAMLLLIRNEREL